MTTRHVHRNGRRCEQCALGDARGDCWNCGDPWCEGCYGPDYIDPPTDYVANLEDRGLHLGSYAS